MCSNETLKVAIDHLTLEVKENTTEQKHTQEALTKLDSVFGTWQKTRCEEHHSQLGDLREKVNSNTLILAKAAGIMVGIQIIGGLLTYWLVAQQLAGHLSKGG